MPSLNEQVALITGGSTGIGFAIADALAAQGANIVLAARNKTLLEQAKSELAKHGTRVELVPTDICDKVQLQRLVKHVEEAFGKIDILVNNAGIETYRDFNALSLDEIGSTVEVNLIAAMQLTRLVIPGMLDRKKGHIINLSSTAGKHGPAFGTAYGASKAGLLSFTQSLRAEYADSGIFATAICPGFTHDGGMYETMKRETGKQTPWYVGSTTSKTVARKVLRALESKAPEYLINRPPLRLVFALQSLFPRFGGWLIRASSYRFLKRVARARPSTASERSTESTARSAA